MTGKVIAAIVAAVVALAAYSAGSSYLAEQREREAARDRQAAYARKVEQQRAAMDGDLAAVRHHLASGKIEVAAAILDAYSNLKDPRLEEAKAQVLAARQAAVVADADKAFREGQYQFAADQIAPLLLDKHLGAQALWAKLEPALKRERAREDAAQRAWKRSQGVRIGMTEKEVLESSWGKPQRVNRTTTARGIKEQWVYGGTNYLYFENGLLVTVQN